MHILGSTFLPVMDVLTRKLSSDDVLHDYDGSLSLTEQVKQIHVLILGMFRVTRETLEAAPKLRLIHQHGRGVEGVELPSATQRGVLVANVPGGNSIAVAEHVLALMFTLAKRMHAMDRSIRNRIIGAPAAVELAGRTVGIVGLGASGKELALRAKALGMKVLATRAHSQRETGVAVDWLGGRPTCPACSRSPTSSPCTCPSPTRRAASSAKGNSP